MNFDRRSVPLDSRLNDCAAADDVCDGVYVAAAIFVAVRWARSVADNRRRCHCKQKWQLENYYLLLMK